MAGREMKSVGKVGKRRLEEKQRKIIEEKDTKKKVMFRLSEESLEKEERKRIREICKDMLDDELKGLEEGRKTVMEEIKG